MRAGSTWDRIGEEMDRVSLHTFQDRGEEVEKGCMGMPLAFFYVSCLNMMMMMMILMMMGNKHILSIDPPNVWYQLNSSDISIQTHSLTHLHETSFPT